jgi:hypothetical protein
MRLHLDWDEAFRLAAQAAAIRPNAPRPMKLESEGVDRRPAMRLAAA